ncbi:MAG TPA: neutral zinc metallopeptidase, partial [Tepidiformaceae bacterium]|nr:neutral zinc metallopeptidase [Tepidiformaceae bacterium]
KIGRRSNDDVIDRRGASPPAAGGLGGMRLPIGLGGSGILIFLLVLVASQLLSGGGGGGFGDIFNQFPGAAVGPQGEQGIPPEADPNRDLVEFVGFVTSDVQDTWESYFAQSNQQYERAQLVLFEQSTQSDCGFATSATGPFYCPADHYAYLDLDFFDELHQRFGAPGDFAGAYVIAHEIGHHVQTLTGISQRVQQETQKNPGDANELSVRQELQADCFAGVWGYSANQRGLLEPGDREEALQAAAAIGDDRIQQQSGGEINQDTWTHGSGDQRVRWFSRGFDSGDPNQCDTFSVDEP